MDHFLYRDGILHAEDVPVPEIAAAVGTPFYCYSEATLTRHYKLFDEALAGMDHLVCFAMKSNSNLAVLRVMANLGAGIDVVSGLHDFLTEDAEYISEAAGSESRLIDVRRNRLKSTADCHRFRPGCIRIHTVGQDCSLGKMVTSLEIHRGLVDRKLNSKFLATGQTGIMISGEGVPIDCVVADFISGAAEQLARQNEQHDFLLIEGQGSISHPAFSAVTLGLLHGSAPDGLIFCYEAGRTHVKGLDDIPIPPMKDQMEAYLVAAKLRHPCKCVGIAINTRHLNDEEALAEIERAESTYGLPTCDVYRTGADKLVEACIGLRAEVLGR